MNPRQPGTHEPFHPIKSDCLLCNIFSRKCVLLLVGVAFVAGSRPEVKCFTCGAVPKTFFFLSLFLREGGRLQASVRPAHSPRRAALIALRYALYASLHSPDGAAKEEVARLTAWEWIMGVPAVARLPLTVPKSRCFIV